MNKIDKERWLSMPSLPTLLEQNCGQPNVFLANPLETQEIILGHVLGTESAWIL